MPTSPERAARDHRAMQLNPEHPAYYHAHGYASAAAERAAEAIRQGNAEHADHGAGPAMNHTTEAREAR